MKYKVENLPTNYENYPYTVIRDCGDDGYWYYCSYSDLTSAYLAANELVNSIPVETSKINC